MHTESKLKIIYINKLNTVELCGPFTPCTSKFRITYISVLMVTYANKGLSIQSYSFSCSHVLMWELDYKKSWAPKNWCFWAAVLEKTLESPLDCQEIQAVNPKVNHSWIFIGRMEAEAETPILWPLDVNNGLIWKDSDAGKDWKQEPEGDLRGCDGWMISDSMDMSKLWGLMMDREAWLAAVQGVTKNPTRIQWVIELNMVTYTNILNICI